MPVTVIGTPAEHARSLARGFLAVSAAAGLIALLCASAAIKLGGTAALALLAGALIAGAVCYERWQRFGRARVGVQAEKDTVRAIRRSGASVVLNGRLLGAGGDLDHLVLGPMAVAIETKAGFGKLYVKDGRVYSGPRQVGKDEIGQVLRQAQAASRILGVRVTPVVCVPGAKGGILRTGEVIVCNADRLPEVLDSAPAVLARHHCDAAVERLQAAHASQLHRRQGQS